MLKMKKFTQLNLKCFHKETLLNRTSILQQLRFCTNEVNEWRDAKPLEQMPRYTKFQLIRAFMPGGKFYNKEFTNILSTVQKEKGNIAYMPGVMGQPNRIITYKPEDFEVIFRNEENWPLRTGLETMHYHRTKHRKEYFEDVIGIMVSNGQQWGSFRSTVNPILMQPKTVKNYINRMSKVNEDFVQRIKDIRNAETLEVPTNFEQEINRWALESVSVVALDRRLGLISGKGDNVEATEFFQHLSTFFELFTKLEIAPPIWKIIKNAEFKRMMGALDGITDFVDKQVNEAKEVLRASDAIEKPDSEKSVLEKLLKIDPKIASVMAMDMMFAGVDSTTTTFTGIMLCLAKFPEKQQKLREEILTILPEKDSPFTDSLKNMPYLRACIKEALRIYPLGPGTIRLTTKDMVLGGYRVPKGTDVSLINFMLLTDSAHFPQPEQFIPERWLRLADKCDRFPGKSGNPFTYFPFGLGPRSCVGKRIVDLELEIAVSRIVRNFHVEFNYPTDNIFKNNLINVPAKPLQFKFSDL